MKKEVHVIVEGRVQLVMFRDFIQRKARRRGIVGTVQNLKDGTVEIFAQGEADKIYNFLSLIRKGSALSRVDNVIIAEQIKLKEYKGFSIIF